MTARGSSNDGNAERGGHDVPTGAPSWVTSELIERTIRVWQPYYKAVLSAEEALAMILNVGRLYVALSGDDGS